MSYYGSLIILTGNKYSGARIDNSETIATVTTATNAPPQIRKFTIKYYHNETMLSQICSSNTYPTERMTSCSRRCICGCEGTVDDDDDDGFAADSLVDDDDNDDVEADDVDDDEESVLRQRRIK